MVAPTFLAPRAGELLEEPRLICRGDPGAGIADADPLAAPRIVANAFGHADDMAEMLDAVKFLRRLASMPALAASYYPTRGRASGVGNRVGRENAGSPSRGALFRLATLASVR